MKKPEYWIEKKNNRYHIHRMVEKEEEMKYEATEIIQCHQKKYLANIVPPRKSWEDAQKIVQSYEKAAQELFERYGG